MTATAGKGLVSGRLGGSRQQLLLVRLQLSDHPCYRHVIGFVYEPLGAQLLGLALLLFIVAEVW